MIKLKYPIKILERDENYFPQNLKILTDCPDIIFALGNVEIMNSFSIAVVGSRICDDYGISVTEKIVRELVNRNVCIVSGLAEGIDTIAHKTAIESGGKTIAVIGSGFGNIYPSSNKKLVSEIIESGGAIISEYFPDQHCMRQLFPMRNRIVACMTEGTIVTEAREKSGALITAEIAKHYEKKLFAVPGNIFSIKNKGNNLLIKSGAKIVLDIDDVMNEFPNYNYDYLGDEKDTLNVDEEFKYLYEIINDSAIHINEISRLANKSIKEIMGDITLLEMSGAIISLSGGYYKRNII